MTVIGAPTLCLARAPKCSCNGTNFGYSLICDHNFKPSCRCVVVIVVLVVQTVECASPSLPLPLCVPYTPSAPPPSRLPLFPNMQWSSWGHWRVMTLDPEFMPCVPMPRTSSMCPSRCSLVSIPPHNLGNPDMRRPPLHINTAPLTLGHYTRTPLCGRDPAHRPLLYVSSRAPPIRPAPRPHVLLSARRSCIRPIHMCPPTSLCSHVRPPPSVRPSLSPCAVSPALITPTYDLLLSRLRGFSPPRLSVSAENTTARRARGKWGRHASKLRLTAPPHATSSPPSGPTPQACSTSPRALPLPRQGSGPEAEPLWPS